MNALLTIKNFQEALEAFPESLRLIIKDDSITSSSEKKDVAALEENHVIVDQWVHALTEKYGEAIARFAFPLVEADIIRKEGASLTSAIVKNSLRKAENINEALQQFHAKLPLPENPSQEEAQAYLTCMASYAQREAVAAVHHEALSSSLTAAITDQLILSLFNATSAEALAALGNHINTHPLAIVDASASTMGTEPHLIAVGSFGITSLIMNAVTSVAVAVDLAKANQQTQLPLSP